jgi:L-ascorbate metabolism protein UlaG (beta-lactamase superfamily)
MKRPMTKKRKIGLGFLVALLAFSAFLIADAWVPFGKAAQGARLERMEKSPQYEDGVFVNPQPLWNDFIGSFSVVLNASPVATPPEGQAVAVVPGTGERFQTAPPSGLRITWLGHSTLVLEIDGKRFLTDPIFGARASPFDWVGPERWYESPIALEQMPTFDAVLISHDHYDHLQQDTIERIKHWDTKFIAPLGVGAHLEYWGVPAERIVEVDWWESVAFGDVTVTTTPARHASGRHLLDQNSTLWAGYALAGPTHRIFFSGDTGLFPGMKDIGDKLGPFDVVMVEVGAYGAAWPDWHIGPEQAIRAHGMLRGKVFLPIHWGLWSLAGHGWTEPAERVLAAAAKANATISIPRPGESIEPSALPPLVKWWPDVPWRTAEQDPIKSTLVD